MGKAGRPGWIIAAAVALAACGAEPEVPPYGFGSHPQQTFQVESHAVTDVDGTAVVIERFADFRVDADPFAASKTELALKLNRYYERVEGAPGGTTEFALSSEGLLARDASGETRLTPDSVTPSGVVVGKLLERPVGGWITDRAGAMIGTPWATGEPMLAGVRVVDWVLLALPVIGSPEQEVWADSRPVPAIGQYVFGVEIPIRYERNQSLEDGRQLIRSNGALDRDRIELAPGFVGRLHLEHAAESDVDASGRVSESRLDLRLRFEAETGTVVAYRVRLRLECTSCTGGVNPES